MSRVKIVVREATDHTIVHEYTPLQSVLSLNGRKKPDDLNVKLLMDNKCDKGDLISYIEDVTDLDYCTAIWNFQLSGLDDRGFNNDSVDIPESKFGMETVDTKFKGNYYFQSNGTNSPITILNATQRYISLLGQFDIYMWITREVQTVTDPVIFSRYDGTTGLEIGLKEVTGVWYPYIRVGNGTSTTVTTFTTEGIPIDQSLCIRIYRDSNGIIRSDVNGITDATTYTETLTLQSPTADLKFGTDRLGANSFVGKLYQIRFYNGTILSETEADQIMQSKAQQFTMKFGGVVWKKDDDTTTKKIYAQSYSNILSEPNITNVTFTQPVLSGTSRLSNEYNGSQDSNPTDICFKTDGTKMYMVGQTSSKVFQYTLSSAWNLSTASYSDISFSVNNQCSNPSGIFFKPDGTKMYVVDDFTQKVYQYILSTAWDISTASYDSKFISVGAQDSDPMGLFFKPDGTKMYVAGDNNNKVFQYTVGTPWDVTTASYASKNVTSEDNTPRGLFFKSDGTKLYIIGDSTDRIYQYTVGTPWDVSTAVYNSVSLNIGGQQAINIIKDIINNVDSSFLVKIGSGTGSYKVSGSFIADGKFYDLVQSLSVLMSSTFFITSRKLFIFEGNSGIDTNLLFDQDGDNTRYKIISSSNNDLSIINDLYLLGTGVVDQFDSVSSGDIVHGFRINVPQFTSGNDLSSLSFALVSTSNVGQVRRMVETPSPIYSARVNHNVTINNSSKNIVSLSDSVESIEQYYPSGKNIIHIGQYPLDYFDIAKTDTKISTGMQSNTVTFPNYTIPNSVINTSSTTGTWKPTNPTGTTSTIGVMGGIGTTIKITPVKTGNIMVIISGEGVNSGAGNGYKVDIRYGTGTSPSNGDALSGTAIGQPVSSVNGTAKTTFPVHGVAVGLSLNTSYWVDIGQYAITAGTVTLTNITVTIIEI